MTQQSLDALYNDFDKLYKDFSSYKSNFDSDLNQLLEECQAFLSKSAAIDESGGDGSVEPSTRLRLQQLHQRLKKRLSEASKRHRELHAPLSKMGKLIDKSFVTELPESLSSAQLESDAEKLQVLNTAICEHLIREGSMEVAQELIREAGLAYEESHLPAYAELNHVVEALAKRQLEPALQWLQDNQKSLSSEETGRYLEFLIRRLQLVQLVSSEDAKPEAILQQARLLAAFSPACDADIRRLMGSLAFVRRSLHSSPYKDLFESRLYHELSQLLVSRPTRCWASPRTCHSPWPSTPAAPPCRLC
ncbi:hypothetical protein BOX15_Mlig026931g2 [Macrostomum lignano]|uniref:CTLH domain-containing protein n=1 Tax=Macrostomum lignano TaxID=282301 RepID=A0A267EAD5_9PLAT|nr:hypothetical protein BOX15_Mlig026931g2 [Macrostomum lignano]